MATASTRHTERLKSLGAEVVFDYKGSNVSQQIREYTGGALKSGGICEIKAEDIDTVVAALSDEGGALSMITFLGEKKFTKDVKIGLSIAYTLPGKVHPCHLRSLDADQVGNCSQSSRLSSCPHSRSTSPRPQDTTRCSRSSLRTERYSLSPCACSAAWSQSMMA